MDEKKIQEIEKELMQQIDDEVASEDEIEAKSDDIAAALEQSNSIKVEIDNSIFILKYRAINGVKKENGKQVPANYILLTAINETKYKIAGTKYKPYTANAEMLPQLTLKENIRGVVNALLRHITGLVPKAEELE